MGRVLAPLAIGAALTSLAHGIQFSKPVAGATLKAGEAIQVEWKDAGDGPPISDLKTFELFLCSGGNDPATINCKLPITTSGDFSKGGLTAQGMVGTDQGADKPANAYFVRMTATAKAGGTLTVYSPRFSYSGQKGTFSDDAIAAIKKVTGTSGPANIDGTVDKATGTAVAPDASLFEVDYVMQTGATRYAPMQPVPGTKVTTKGAKMQYPTSSVPIAKDWLPIPTIETTVTQSQTHKASSRANPEPAQSGPSDDMAKFLARWKD